MRPGFLGHPSPLPGPPAAPASPAPHTAPQSSAPGSCRRRPTPVQQEGTSGCRSWDVAWSQVHPQLLGNAPPTPSQNPCFHRVPAAPTASDETPGSSHIAAGRRITAPGRGKGAVSQRWGRPPHPLLGDAPCDSEAASPASDTGSHGADPARGSGGKRMSPSWLHPLVCPLLTETGSKGATSARPAGASCPPAPPAVDDGARGGTSAAMGGGVGRSQHGAGVPRERGQSPTARRLRAKRPDTGPAGPPQRPLTRRGLGGGAASQSRAGTGRCLCPAATSLVPFSQLSHTALPARPGPRYTRGNGGRLVGSPPGHTRKRVP